jgi:transposase-like protein
MCASAKFWYSVITQLRNHGLRDILIVRCDGLSGLPDAVTTVFPDTIRLLSASHA